MRFFPWPPSTLNGAASLPGGLQNDLPAGDDAQVDDFVERVGEMLEEMEKEQEEQPGAPGKCEGVLPVEYRKAFFPRVLYRTWLLLRCADKILWQRNLLRVLY